MIRQPPRYTRPDTLVPYTTRVRSSTDNNTHKKAPRLRGFFFDNDQRLFAIAAVVLVVDDPDQVAARAHRLAGEHQPALALVGHLRSDGHTSDIHSLMRISYAVSCMKKKNPHHYYQNTNTTTT